MLKKKFGSMGTATIRELRQLREGKPQAQALDADLSLDKTMLQDVIYKNRSADATARRLAVSAQGLQISERRACQVIVVNRSTVQHKSVKTDVLALPARINEIAATRVRYGYRRIHVLLRREGWSVNRKRVYHIYRERRLVDAA